MPPAWTELYRRRRVEAPQALKKLRSGSRVFVGSGCGVPRHLLRELAGMESGPADVELLQVLSLAQEELQGLCQAQGLRYTQVFVAAAARQEVCEGSSDYIPLDLTQVPHLLTSGRWPIDAALIQVSPPDEHGFVSLGVAVDVAMEAAAQARVVIAQVNPAMPRTLGQGFLPVASLTNIVEYEEPLLDFQTPEPDELDLKVAGHAVRLIEDGSTIHCGLGRLPQAVLGLLTGKKKLGVHTNALSDPHLALVKAGAIDGSGKTVFPGKMVASFCLGGPELFRFVDNNPQVELHPVRLTNDPAVIRKNPRMVAVHEAVELDLTGQVCAGAVGGRVFAGLGAMRDFMRGASQSQGGQGLVLLTSTRPDGSSRISASLSPGAEVSLSRSEVRTVITEYGAAYLQGLNLRERALALIDLAHPNHRDNLLSAAREQGLISPDQVLVPLFTGVYPEQYERSLELADGSQIFIRPVKPADERLVQEFFYSMSDHEVYYRFLHGLKSFPRKDMQQMVNVDYHRQMALLALAGEFGQQEVVGLGRYVLGSEGLPEVDFAVRGDHQGRGLGRAIMQALVDIARDRGFTGLSAVVLAENKASLHILSSLGYAVSGTVSQGISELVIHLDQPVDEPTVDLKYQRQTRSLDQDHLTQI